MFLAKVVHQGASDRQQAISPAAQSAADLAVATRSTHIWRMHAFLFMFVK